MKNVYVFILIIFCCLSATNKIMAQSGTTGTCTWALSGTSPNYTLTISPPSSGTGTMGDYTNSNTAPWFSYQNYISTVIIQQGVTNIGELAFWRCSRLTSVTISNSVTTIGIEAFYNCPSFTSINIPYSVTNISSRSFRETGLTNISVDANNPVYSSVDGVVFNKNQTTLVRYPCKKTGSYTIPNTVTRIEVRAFYYCHDLTSVTIPNSVKTIESYAFSECYGLTSITIPNSVTYIGDDAFFACYYLTSAIIGNSVTTIKSATFWLCTNLSSLTIGNSVTSIATYAFKACSNLTEIYIKAVNPPSLLSTDNVFGDVSTAIPVYVPCGSVSAYQNASVWSSFTNIIGDMPYSISLQSNDATMGNVNVIQANSCTNDTIIITAIPNNCYSFMNWSDGNTQNPRTMEITSDTSVTAVFAPTAASIVANDTTVCSGTSASLTISSSVSGATYKWYSSQAASSPFHTGASYTTSNLTADTTFYIGVLANGCETASGDRKEVKVSIKSTIAVSALLPEICPGITTQLTPNSGGSWTSSSSDSNIVEIINSGTIRGKKLGTATLTFYDSSSTCSTSVEVKVKDYPNPEEITGSANVVCVGKTITLSHPDAGIWKHNNSNISLDDLSANPVTVTGLKEGQSFVSYTVYNGICKTIRTFRVKVIPVPTTPPKIIIGVER